MTKRERLYPEIKRLREDEGLMWREIGERVGLSHQTVWDYYNDPTGEKHRARLTEHRLNDYGPCPSCGARVNGATLRRGGCCMNCHRDRERLAVEARVQDVAEMYREGLSIKEIARNLGYGPNSRPPQISEAHRRGLIEHRYKAYEQKAAA